MPRPFHGSGSIDYITICFKHLCDCLFKEILYVFHNLTLYTNALCIFVMTASLSKMFALLAGLGTVA